MRTLGLAVLAAVVLAHVLLTLEVVHLSRAWLGGSAITLLVVAVAAAHLVAFRRLAGRRADKGAS